MSVRPGAPLVELSNVSLGYDGRPILAGIDLTVDSGSLTALVGPNGGGKSTLLKAIAGELKPMAGRISGQDRASTGYLAQSFEFDRRFPIRVKHVVAMGLWRRLGPFGNLRKGDADIVENALAQVGLSRSGGKAIGDLSGGELQRCLFARLIVLDPWTILLDEPFTAIDRSTVSDLITIIQNWHREGRTVVAALHDFDQVRAIFPEAIRVAGGATTRGETERIIGGGEQAHLVPAKGKLKLNAPA